MGRPKEHDDAVRVLLLEAAERLVGEGGPAALSVRVVADEVGTTTRAVYSVFGSKAGLLAGLAVRLFELLSQAIDDVELTDDPVADVVTASIDGFRRVALTHSSLYSLVFLRVVPDLELGADFHAVADAAFGRLQALVARAADGRLTAPELADVAGMIHALTEGLATMELRGALGPADRAERLWRSSLEALLQGLAGSDGPLAPEPPR
jgi:AcrR family transcriptional regulator